MPIITSLISWCSERPDALAISLSVLCFAFAWSLLRVGRSSSTIAVLPVPPGPKPLPFIGNALDVPAARPWLKFHEWRQSFGDVIYLHLPHQPMLILGSAKAAIDLLEQRQIYADRPRSVMAEILGWEWNVGLMPYGSYWRKVRRPLHHHFHQGVVHHYQPLQTKGARALLRRLLTSPGHVVENIRQSTAATILQIVYGLEILDGYDEYLSLAEPAVEYLTEAAVPGAFWVEFLPFLKHIPEWTPGAKFHKVGVKCRPLVAEMRNRPFEAVKVSVANNTATPSMACTLIQGLQKYNDASMREEQERIAKDATGVAYAASTDTSTASLSCLLAAMALHPAVQQKAQAELDACIGQRRLPEFEDLDALVYFKAVVLESMRWQPVTPFGVPHLVNADDEYKGYYIPKNSIVIANIWGILHDSEEYPKPDLFNPERFVKDGKLNPEVMDPFKIAFGFGRRVCVGRHLAKESIWIILASILHVYNIELPRDEHGSPIECEMEMSSTLISHPTAFPYVLKPRSAAAERLILESEH